MFVITCFNSSLDIICALFSVQIFCTRLLNSFKVCGEVTVFESLFTMNKQNTYTNNRLSQSFTMVLHSISQGVTNKNENRNTGQLLLYHNKTVRKNIQRSLEFETLKYHGFIARMLVLNVFLPTFWKSYTTFFRKYHSQYNLELLTYLAFVSVC